MLKKVGYIFLMMSFIFMVTSCGAKEGKEERKVSWMITEESNDIWAEDNVTKIDASARYVLSLPQNFLYITYEDNGLDLHNIILDEQQKEIVVPLKYPETDIMAVSQLINIYAGKEGETNFWGLWDIDTAGNRYELVQYDLEGNAQTIVKISDNRVQDYGINIRGIIQKENRYYLDAREDIVVLSLEGEIVKVEAPEKLWDFPLKAEWYYISEDGTIFIANGTQLYSCDLENRTAQCMLKWDEVGVKYLDIRGLVKTSSEEVIILTYENSKYVLSTLKPGALADQRTVITFFENQYENFYQQIAYEFNKTNKEYKVVIEDPGIAEYDWDELQTFIQLLLISDDAPDIVDLNFIDQWHSYAENGVFEDLSPYVSNSDSVKEANYFPSVYNCGKVTDKQIFIPYTFCVNMWYGLEKYLGTEMGWTLQDVMDFAKEHPDIPLMNADAAAALDYLIRVGYKQFVDETNRKCNFNTPLFYEVLEYAANSKYKPSNAEEYYEVIVLEEELLGMPFLINKESYLKSTGILKNNNGESEIKFALKGFPSVDGSLRAEAFITNGKLAICSNSKNKEGAWQFLEYIQNYKDDFILSSAFPARIDWFEERELNFSDNWWNSEIEKREFTEEDEKTLLKIIDSLESSNYEDELIIQIILEDSQAYLLGNKSAEDVAATIQSRVQLYLDEQN